MIDITYTRIYDIITLDYTNDIVRLLSVGLHIMFPDNAKQVINNYIDVNSFPYHYGYIKLLYKMFI